VKGGKEYNEEEGWGGGCSFIFLYLVGFEDTLFRCSFLNFFSDDTLVPFHISVL
jgi:hypothetical protein